MRKINNSRTQKMKRDFLIFLEDSLKKSQKNNCNSSSRSSNNNNNLEKKKKQRNLIKLKKKILKNKFNNNKILKIKVVLLPKKTNKIAIIILRILLKRQRKKSLQFKQKIKEIKSLVILRSNKKLKFKLKMWARLHNKNSRIPQMKLKRNNCLVYNNRIN